MIQVDIPLASAKMPFMLADLFILMIADKFFRVYLNVNSFPYQVVRYTIPVCQVSYHGVFIHFAPFHNSTIKCRWELFKILLFNSKQINRPLALGVPAKSGI